MKEGLPQGFTLLPMEDSDAAFVRNCIRESVLASVEGWQRDLAGIWIDDIVALSMQNISQRSMQDEVFVLSAGGKQIGMLWMGVSRDQFTCDPTGYLLGIYVSPSLRNKGFGTMLLEAAEQWCRDRDLLTMTLNAGIPNEPALSLYRKNGYAPQTCVMQKPLQ